MTCRHAPGRVLCGCATPCRWISGAHGGCGPTGFPTGDTHVEPPASDGGIGQVVTRETAPRRRGPTPPSDSLRRSRKHPFFSRSSATCILKDTAVLRLPGSTRLIGVTPLPTSSVREALRSIPVPPNCYPTLHFYQDCPNCGYLRSKIWNPRAGMD